MKVANNQKVPDFTINDVFGNPVAISSFKGQKVHLNFYRFSGCEFCNLRFHQIQNLADSYKKNNVKLISVFESSAENMKDQMEGQTFYATLIPDTESKLYKLFELDRSMFGLFKYLLFKGGLGNASQGKKLFKKKVKLDGHLDRIVAEFLIDANGIVVNAHYGKDPGDFLNINVVKEFIGV